MSSHILRLGALLLFVNTAWSLTCYSCDSSKQVACPYSLLSFALPTMMCNESSNGGILDSINNLLPKQCYKLIGKDKEGNEYIARGCSTLTGEGLCKAIASTIHFADNKDLTIDCAVCTTDKCNSASKFGGMTTVGLIIACLAYLF